MTRLEHSVNSSVLFGVKIGQQHGKFTPDWQFGNLHRYRLVLLVLVCNEIRLELAGRHLILPRIVCAWLGAYFVCPYGVC